MFEGAFDVLAFFAVIGLIAFFGMILPGIGYLSAMAACRLVSGEWNQVAGYVGAGIGLLPGILFIADIIWTPYIRERRNNDR
jgi:hypothetical protein